MTEIHGRLVSGDIGQEDSVLLKAIAAQDQNALLSRFGQKRALLLVYES